MRSSGILAALVVVALGASACSGDDDPKADPSKTPSPSASDTGIISPPLPDMPKWEGKPQGVIKDVQVSSCDTTSGTVTAKGTATNSGDKARDLAVVMSWAVTTTSDVVARAVAKLEDVAPGDTVDWSVKTTMKSDATVACVPTAYAGTLR